MSYRAIYYLHDNVCLEVIIWEVLSSYRAESVFRKRLSSSSIKLDVFKATLISSTLSFPSNAVTSGSHTSRP
jgi:hypothetical protein